MTRRMHNEPKHVYFVRPVGMDGPIKIGCSVDPSGRLQVLSAWSPFPLELIGSVLGDFKDEARLHTRFSELHTRKEWFMSSPLLRETIERILAGTSIKEACKEIPPKKSIRNQKRPIRTEDREMFLQYGNRIRKVMRPLWGTKGRWWKPDDVEAIMHNWRRDKGKGHITLIPSPDQIARLEEFIADPKKFCRFEAYPPRPKKDPICIPVVVSDAELAA